MYSEILFAFVLAPAVISCSAVTGANDDDNHHEITFDKHQPLKISPTHFHDAKHKTQYRGSHHDNKYSPLPLFILRRDIGDFGTRYHFSPVYFRKERKSHEFIGERTLDQPYVFSSRRSYSGNSKHDSSPFFTGSNKAEMDEMHEARRGLVPYLYHMFMGTTDDTARSLTKEKDPDDVVNTNVNVNRDFVDN